MATLDRTPGTRLREKSNKRSYSKWPFKPQAALINLALLCEGKGEKRGGKNSEKFAHTLNL